MEHKVYSTLDVRIRAVRAVDSGEQISTVSRSFQVHPATLHRWLVRSRKSGESGLNRIQVSGRPRIIDSQTMKMLMKTILKPASKFGFETDFWTCRRMIQVASDQFGIRISQPTMWRMLRDMDLSYQKPERIYREGSDTERSEWIRTIVPKIRKCVDKYNAILYFEDESNISLTAPLGKTWSPRGKTPIAKVHGRRGGVAAISAISRSGHLAFTLLETRIGSDEIIHFLRQLILEHQHRHLVVVMDQASPHTSAKTMKFIESQKRLHVFHLPPYSPKFNPDEYVWNHLKHQELKWHQAKTKYELMDLAAEKLKAMAKDRDLIKGIWFRCCIAELMN
jgi:transposase